MIAGWEGEAIGLGRSRQCRGLDLAGFRGWNFHLFHFFGHLFRLLRSFRHHIPQRLHRDGNMVLLPLRNAHPENGRGHFDGELGRRRGHRLGFPCSTEDVVTFVLDRHLGLGSLAPRGKVDAGRTGVAVAGRQGLRSWRGFHHLLFGGLWTGLSQGHRAPG